MEIAILVVFLAIFGGALFLALLVWFLFRRRRNSGSQNQNVPSSSNQPIYTDSYRSDDDETDFDEASVQNYENNPQTENPTSDRTAYDSPIQTESVSSGASQSDYAAPAAPSYNESSSSYDSGGSSSDSGSSSSDSGSSSSSD